jgi:hypothetical protein
MMQEAQKELRRAVETKRATQIGDTIYHRNVPADPADLRNERSAKMFKMAKGKDLEKKAKGGRVGLKGGADAGKIPTTPKEKKFAAIAEPKNRITYRDKIEGAKKRG